MGRDRCASSPNQRIGEFWRGTFGAKVRRTQKVLNGRRGEVRQQCTDAVGAGIRNVRRPGVALGIRQSRNPRL